MGDVDDQYTGNDDVGHARQTGFAEFWAIATAQSVFWNAPRTSTNLYAAETGLIQAGVSTTAYVENTAVTVALSGVQCKLKTAAVASFDLLPGSAITINLSKMEMTTNRAFLTGTHVKANSALKAEELINQCQTAMTKARNAVTNIDDGSFCATIGEALRA